MTKETGQINKQAVDELNVQRTDWVLDIGCGSGFSLQLLAELATDGHVSGVDPSAVMVKRSAKLNKRAVDAGLVDVKLAAMERLPYADAKFDKVMSVHTVYFLDRLDIGFTEVARVSKLGAELALVVRTTANQTAVNNFPSEIYRFRPIAEITQSLEQAGFGVYMLRAETDDEAAIIYARRVVEKTAKK